MNKTANITASSFKSEWKNPSTGALLFYHEVELDNGDKGSIGSKDKSPDFLTVGRKLEYTIEGDKIKRAKPMNNFGSGGYKPDTVGITVGACLNLSVSMFNHGKIDKDKIVATADWLIEQSFALKSKHSNKS